MSKQRLSIHEKQQMLFMVSLRRTAPMVLATCETLDPRIRRTRDLLQQALAKLLETRAFDKISVQDITDYATLNRATFYDHYTDKFALLEAMVGCRFHQLLAQRQ